MKASNHCRKQVRFTPRRFVRDQDIHTVDGCLLSGRQLVLRRQQSTEYLVAAAGGAEKLAAAIEALFPQPSTALSND